MNQFLEYIKLGTTHVIPFGYDHILFIMSLCLLSSSLKTAIIQCSVFTISHSFSLALAALGFIVPNPNIIEPLIAISILYTTIENIISDSQKKIRLLVIFIFGLIHGMGFSFALNEIGLPKSDFISALLAFNIGVELGQIVVIILTYLIFVFWFRKKTWFRSRIIYPISSIIGSIALVMTINRIFEIL